jgi:CRISPR/Cas system-associated exonuclease Cas4 (RecB family)
LDGGDLVPTKFNENIIKKTETLLLETYNQINNKEPDEAYGKVGQHCRRCDYRKICPFYSLT